MVLLIVTTVSASPLATNGPLVTATLNSATTVAPAASLAVTITSVLCPWTSPEMTRSTVPLASSTRATEVSPEVAA